jgi:threonine dehydratase
LISFDQLAAARSRIRGGAGAGAVPLVLETPVVSAPELAPLVDAGVRLKLENLQRTGSFKVRGAANKLLTLSSPERVAGVVACSSGNHGRAVAFVAARLGIPAVICVPEWVDPAKLAAIEAEGAEALLAGTTYDEAEEAAADLARTRGLTLVHPFDDPAVIAGQGTIGLELLEQVPDLAVVAVPLSGGGLIGGIASAVKHTKPSIRVVAVSAQNADVMLQSQRAGRPIQCPESHTIATALSGGIGLDNAHTFALVRDLVDEHVTVSEDELEYAMGYAADRHHVVVEGGGAAALAAVAAGKISVPGGSTLVAVVSGGNIDGARFGAILRAFAPAASD